MVCGVLILQYKCVIDSDYEHDVRGAKLISDIPAPAGAVMNACTPGGA